MALEEFTGDLSDRPVELPCHTQRPALRRDKPRKSFSAARVSVALKRSPMSAYQFINIKYVCIEETWTELVANIVRSTMALPPGLHVRLTVRITLLLETFAETCNIIHGKYYVHFVRSSAIYS